MNKLFVISESQMLTSKQVFEPRSYLRHLHCERKRLELMQRCSPRRVAFERCRNVSGSAQSLRRSTEPCRGSTPDAASPLAQSLHEHCSVSRILPFGTLRL